MNKAASRRRFWLVTAYKPPLKVDRCHLSMKQMRIPWLFESGRLMEAPVATTRSDLVRRQNHNQRPPRLPAWSGHLIQSTARLGALIFGF